MPFLLAALMLLFAPVTTPAQSSRHEHPPSALGPIGLPLPAIGLPLPPIGLPLPPIGLQRPVPQPRRGAAGGDRRRPDGPRPPSDKHRPRPRPSIVYVVPPYAVGYDTVATSPTPGTIAAVAPAASPISGTLHLEVEPADIAQLYVDGQYVGTPRDVGGALDLDPGTRRVEIRAPGHRGLAFDVKVVAGRTITYRGALDRVAGDPPLPDSARREPPAASAAAPPPEPTTLYFIPGCYMGNVPPKEVKLPEGCDLARLITKTP
jgi:hypothetical protein